jgi:sporulation protein YlmC with PRC-barrel domain
MSQHESPISTFAGHEVVDEHGEAIGKITDVIYDVNQIDEPRWLIVDPGVFRAEHYVPAAGAYTTEGGRVVVPYDKRWVRSAPKAGDHVMTDDVLAELGRHYEPADA